MAGKIPVTPGRVNCPTCKAKPGEPCYVVVFPANGGPAAPTVPPIPRAGYHETRRLAATYGQV